MPLLVVYGLPGVGKKTLIEGVKEVTKESENYIYIRCDSTNKEDFDPQLENALTEEEYKKNKDDRLYCCEWAVGKFFYALPESIIPELQRERKVIVSLPYGVLPLIGDLFLAEFNVKIIHVVAPVDLILERVKSKDKNWKNIAKKLKKPQEFELQGDNIVLINNALTEAQAMQAMVQAIGFDPVIDVPQGKEFNIKTCSPQEYLQRTVFPILNSALTLIERERPPDPIEYLALYLYRDASSQYKRVRQLEEIHALRQQLTQEMKAEYSVPGRI